MVPERLGSIFLLLPTLCLLLAGTALAQAPGEENLGKVLPFRPDQWMTAKDYPPLGDPRALRVSEKPFKIAWQAFPTTLRTDGPNSNTTTNVFYLEGMMFETLIGIHPETEEFLPGLASHWKRVVDKEKRRQTFWFRINPKARFADGSEVTAADVYWSWWHKTREDRKDPSNLMTFKENYEEPEIVDKYTIKITTKELNWRLFLYIGGMWIFPAKEIRIPGDRFLDEYNWKYMTGSGPYVMKPEDLKKGESITLTRRDDWWAEDETWAKNTFNFQKIKYVVVRDRELIYEMFKKGELDYFIVGRAQRWVEIIPNEPLVKGGWVKRRKVYTQRPQGANGLVFNMRKWPFDDKNVRLAFCHLFNRERLMEKLFFNQYEYTGSYWPGSDWGDGENNPEMYFDPELAAEYLAKAGYTKRNNEGWLVDSKGRVLELTLQYAWQAWERIWLVVQEDYRNAGINLQLKLLDYSTLLRKISDRQFRIHFQAWTPTLFPNPETSWRSDLADKKANNNLPGFRNKRVDELCEQYNVVFDRTEQKKIIREIDSIIYKEYPYALAWYGNFQRILYWDKFGHPGTYFTRTGLVPERDLLSLWWFDPEREARMQKAHKEKQALPQGEVEVRPWGDSEK